MELYKIEARTRAHLEAMEDAIDPETGELNPVFMDQLDALDIETKYKIEAIGVFIREMKGDIATIRDERHRLEARELSMKKRVSWLVDYASGSMRSLGIGKHTSPSGWFTVWLQGGSGKLQVDYPDNLPAKFQYIAPVKPRLDDLKAAIKDNAVSDSVLAKAGVRTIVSEKKVRYR